MAKLNANDSLGPYPYRIIKPLDAHGGMSSVYLATDGALNDPRAPRVVIKVSRTHKEYQDFYQDTIYNEAERLRNLHHRGVVRILPVKMVSDMHNLSYAARTNRPGSPWFLVLEYLGGGSVDKLIEKRGRVDPGSALEIARIVAETLQFLHDQAQVHLDIKPENILFRRPLEDGPPVEPVLVDFGVARTAGQEGLEARTLPYAPPERVAVHKQSAPPETLARPHSSMDVYSLGVVLYQMLTGRRPFEGRSNKKLSSAIMEGNPTLPSHYVSSLPKAIDDLVLVAMAKDPSRRPSAGELARRCSAVMRDARLTPEIFVAARGRRGRARRRWGWAALGLVGLAALLLAGALTLNGRPGVAPQLVPVTSAVAGAVERVQAAWGAIFAPAAPAPPGGPTPTLGGGPALPANQVIAAIPSATPTVTPSPSATMVRPPTSTPVVLTPTPTPSPEPTDTPVRPATVTPVATRTPTPAATDTATPTRTPTRTPTLRPTSTPVRATNTPTLRPTNTRAPTRPPAASAPPDTPTRPPSAPVPVTAAPVVEGGPVRLLSLWPHNHTIDGNVAFQWEADQPLAPGQAFEVLIWQQGHENAARPYKAASTASWLEVNLGELPPATYYWCVWLVWAEPYDPIRCLGGGELWMPEP